MNYCSYYSFLLTIINYCVGVCVCVRACVRAVSVCVRGVPEPENGMLIYCGLETYIFLSQFAR